MLMFDYIGCSYEHAVRLGILSPELDLLREPNGPLWSRHDGTPLFART